MRQPVCGTTVHQSRPMMEHNSDATSMQTPDTEGNMPILQRFTKYAPPCGHLVEINRKPGEITILSPLTNTQYIAFRSPSPLSNFDEVNNFRVNGVLYKSNEQQFQARKDPKSPLVHTIMSANRPVDQKRAGDKVATPADWEGIREQRTMIEGLWVKFSREGRHKNALLSTGDAILLEATKNFKWAINRDIKCNDIANWHRWTGCNWLGLAMMQVRDDIRQGCTNPSSYAIKATLPGHQDLSSSVAVPGYINTSSTPHPSTTLASSTLPISVTLDCGTSPPAATFTGFAQPPSVILHSSTAPHPETPVCGTSYPSTALADYSRDPSESTPSNSTNEAVSPIHTNQVGSSHDSSDKAGSNRAQEQDSLLEVPVQQAELDKFIDKLEEELFPFTEEEVIAPRLIRSVPRKYFKQSRAISDPEFGSGDFSTRNGCFVKGQFESEGMIYYLIDSGSEVTMISTNRYNAIPEDKRPELYLPNFSITSVNGQPLEMLGAAVMRITIGMHVAYKEVVVANIQDDAILGRDFLEAEGVEISFRKHLIQFPDGETAHTISQVTHRDTYKQDCLRVVSTEKITIPALSRMDIAALIKHTADITEEGIVEPNPVLVEKQMVMVARTLVNTSSSSIVLQIMNPTEKDVTIHARTTLGWCHSTDGDAQPIRVQAKEDKSVRRATTGQDQPQDVSDEVPDHLQEVYDEALEELHVDEEGCKRLRHILRTHANTWQENDEDYGRTNLVKHTIDTGTAPPVKQRVRQQPLTLRQVEEEQVKTMLEADIIEAATGPWASPVVLAKKKDGTYRFCVDYRMLNERTRKDAYPLPKISDCFDSLAGAQWFCTLDLAAGYWQVEMEEADKPKTAFCTRSGLYQYKVMSFGLCNAPATFERLMENVLRGLQWEECLVYIDDVIIFGKTVEETLDRLEHVLDRLSHAGLKLKPSKCKLFKKKVEFLGHIVSPEGVQTDPAKIEAVKAWPQPTTQKQVRSFLGLASYYRKFVKGFAGIAKPLHALTEHQGKKKAITWTPECEEAFDKLKEALTSAPILAYPRPEGHITLDTDASGGAVGCVLSQDQEGEERVLGYMSKCLSKAERNYCVTRRELLAVVTALNRYHHYTFGRPVTIRTDNSAVMWLKQLKDPQHQMARWLQKIDQYDIEFNHRPGRIHWNGDALSRRPCPQCGKDDGVCEEDRITRRAATIAARINKRVMGTAQIAVVTRAQQKALTEEESEVHHPQEVQQATPQKSTLDIHYKEPTEAQLVQPTNVGEAVPLNLRSDRYQPTMLPIMEEEESVVNNQSDVHENNMKAHNSESATPLKENNMGWMPGWTPPELQRAQVEDADMSPIMMALMEQQGRPSKETISVCSAKTKELWGQWDRLRLDRGVMHRRYENEMGTQINWQIVVPSTMQDYVVRHHHDGILGGHFNDKKTLAKVRRMYYWPRMSTHIKRYCRTCDGCVARKTRKRKHKAPLKTFPMGTSFDRISIDIMGPLTKTKKGNKYVVVVTDHFTKWTEAYATRNQEAATVAQPLVKYWVAHHGPPRSLHSDQGSQFESDLFQRMCRMLDIDKTRTTGYHPEGNGQVERYNRTLGAMLAIYCEENYREWDEHLPYVAAAYRATEHSSTGYTPNMMVKGREIPLPLHIVHGDPNRDQEPLNPEDFVDNLQDMLEKAHALARHHLGRSATVQKQQYDHRANERPAFTVGQPVWLLEFKGVTGVSKKLQSPWKPGWVVMQQLDDVNYRVKAGPHKKSKIVHVNRLMPYEGRNPPSWYQTTC